MRVIVTLGTQSIFDYIRVAMSILSLCALGGLTIQDETTHYKRHVLSFYLSDLIQCDSQRAKITDRLLSPSTYYAGSTHVPFVQPSSRRLWLKEANSEKYANGAVEYKSGASSGEKRTGGKNKKENITK